MRVERRIEKRGPVLQLTIRAFVDDAEAGIISQFGLSEYHIRTREGAMGGRDKKSRNAKLAYRNQLGKVRNRWSMALVRTTGYLLIDAILRISFFLYQFAKALMVLIFGRQSTLSDALME